MELCSPTTWAGGNTTLALNLTYSGLSGAAGKISSMSLGNGTYNYSASYDTGMRLTSAGLTNSSSGTQLYQTQPTYDAQGRLSLWQNQPTSPTATVNSLYDGSAPVRRRRARSMGPRRSPHIGSVEEVQSSGSSTQTTTYYAVGGKRVAADVNGTFYSFGYDALGSQVAVLNAAGSLIGAQLYGPYGARRYNTGRIPGCVSISLKPFPSESLMVCINSS